MQICLILRSRPFRLPFPPKQRLFIFADREIISHRSGAGGRHGQVPETRQSDNQEDEIGSDLDSATFGLTEGQLEPT